MPATIGGTYIKLAPGSSACINVMEIRPTLTPEMELIDELDYNDIDSMLAKDPAVDDFFSPSDPRYE